MQLKEANARTEKTEPNTSTSDDQHDHCATIKMESSDTSQIRKSSKEKVSTRDVPLSTGMLDFVSYFGALQVVVTSQFNFRNAPVNNHTRKQRKKNCALISYLFLFCPVVPYHNDSCLLVYNKRKCMHLTRMSDRTF